MHCNRTLHELLLLAFATLTKIRKPRDYSCSPLRLAGDVFQGRLHQANEHGKLSLRNRHAFPASEAA